VANHQKRSSLSEAFGDVSSRSAGLAAATEKEEHATIKKPETEQVEMVPVKEGRLVTANTPVNMTFTVTAKERYDWSLELRRRGFSAVSVLRKAMNELLEEGKE
jgi:hypothetical protein